ncbi:hypothetical protein CAEBREN_06204 [Caenorhabditis brenneri]|uniref:Uncharacterized protein n=1 Tax=Caenorhabditis brenneri TaxID=135651 RepID=G0NZM6_CAEBE|nr:hypothetical protein CAEBREN_06204 [Caenorhabditis brenneri]
MQKPWHSNRSAEEPPVLTTATKKLEPLLVDETTGLPQSPKDTRNYVYLMFMVFGFGALLPWNMFINISHDYYTNFKLQYNGTKTWESDNFQFLMPIASQLPNLIFSIANIFLAVKGDLTRRMRHCLAVVQIMILITIICIYVDTESWTTLFFTMTIFSIIFLNAANGLYQNSLFGLASSFPFKYTNAIIIGQNFCGIIVALIATSTKAIADEVQLRAFLYFGIAAVIVLICLILLNIIKKFTFFKVYDVTEANAYDDDDDIKKEITTWEDVRIAFGESTPQFVNIFLLFFVTLSLFPNIVMYVKDNAPGKPHNFIVSEYYFMDICIFLNFNTFAFLGSLLANYVRKPSPNKIWIAVVARFWFLFYFPNANYYPEFARGYAPIFTSTWIFLINLAIMAFTSGYFSSLIMMYAPRYHEEPRIQRMAGMIAAFFLIAGVFTGLCFSGIIKFFILNI